MVSFSRLFVSSVMAAAAMAAPVNVPQKRTASKVGAAYNDPSLVSVVSSASWAYNWADGSGGDLPSGVEYVPMIWGTQSFAGWSSAIESAISAGAKYVLGFNEPDMPTQANMSPAEAVGYYKQYVTPLKNRVTLGTPAVTNGGGSMGLAWLQEYLDICDGTCGQKFVNIHWYEGGTAESMIADFQSHVNQAIDIAQQHNIHEVWVTEFGTVGVDPSVATQFISEARAFLDGKAEVGRYAYFMAGDGTLLSGNTLSALGTAYNGS